MTGVRYSLLRERAGKRRGRKLSVDTFIGL